MKIDHKDDVVCFSTRRRTIAPLATLDNSIQRRSIFKVKSQTFPEFIEEEETGL